MRLIDKGKYFQYLPQNDGPAPELLLGVRQRKNDPWYMVENNLINQIVLGQPWQQPGHPVLKHTDRLAEYQLHDIQKMLTLPHALNANPMGLGKTVEAIGMLREADARNGLLIVPKIICNQWKNQMEAWWPDSAGRVEVVEDGQVPNVLDDGTFWIINYEKLQSQATLNKFRQFSWEFLIVDEAHRIKNRKSKRTESVKSVPAQHRHALTGTPILRYVDDLWSILHFLDETYSGYSYWNFVNYFCEIDETPWGRKLVGLTKDPSKVAILNTLMERISIRNNVEVAHGKRAETVVLPMSKAQRKLYKDLRNLVLEELPDTVTVANGAVLTMRLRQLTSWPGLFLEEEVGSKFEYILDKCQDNPDEKFVIFSCFEKTISALIEYLNKNGVSAVSITGQNKAQQNENNKERFLKTKTQVLAGTIGAMGQGYDGLQEVARLMIIIDRDWSPEIMAQCEDRLKRMGQNNPVLITYLECTGSFDQYVGRINMTKAEDIRLALEGT